MIGARKGARGQAQKGRGDRGFRYLMTRPGINGDRKEFPKKKKLGTNVGRRKVYSLR